MIIRKVIGRTHAEAASRVMAEIIVTNFAPFIVTIPV